MEIGSKKISPRARIGASAAALFAVAVGALALASPARPDAAATTAGGTGFARTALVAAAFQGGFSHSTPRHAEQSCDNCHRREGASPRPALPGHKSCDDCHIQEFMTSGSQFCATCHTDMGQARPPLKAFPPLRSFNARFDHAKHTGGAGRPEAGCSSCHLPARRGVALSIPAGAGAHENCYQCHTPGSSAGGLSSCSSCHAPGRFSRTPTNARAFAVGFSHAAHGPRQRLSCDRCHTVRAGAAQGRQVSSPAPTQHFGSARAQTCMTCHNNRRAFGGEDFADCKRCHKGQTFRF
ncbi:MAG TPA: cytochrome c3 family protein [Pyrinomonadaceae bacterium]|nr:cytochrome c3 family protein [Pyrinomonadaceae bacterium]